MTKTKAKKKSTIRLLFVCAIRTTGEGEVWRKALRGGLYLAYVGGEREAVLSVSRLAPAQPGKTELDIIRRDFNDAAADCGREIYEFVHRETVAVMHRGATFNIERFVVQFVVQDSLFETE